MSNELDYYDNLPFENVSKEEPCTKCGSSSEEDVLHCDSCGRAIPHGQENFYPAPEPELQAEGENVCYCIACDEFGPDDEDQIPYVHCFGIE